MGEFGPPRSFEIKLLKAFCVNIWSDLLCGPKWGKVSCYGVWNFTTSIVFLFASLLTIQTKDKAWSKWVGQYKKIRSLIKWMESHWDEVRQLLPFLIGVIQPIDYTWLSCLIFLYALHIFGITLDFESSLEIDCRFWTLDLNIILEDSLNSLAFEFDIKFQSQVLDLSWKMVISKIFHWNERKTLSLTP